MLIADDRARTRHALRAVFSTAAGLDVIGEAGDGEEALQEIARLRPDVVVLDVCMPRLDGVAATSEIKARWPSVRVVAHSMAVERAAECLSAGADAFVPKGAPIAELLAALSR